jgi:hypothetical protein
MNFLKPCGLRRIGRAGSIDLKNGQKVLAWCLHHRRRIRIFWEGLHRTFLRFYEKHCSVPFFFPCLWGSDLIVSPVWKSNGFELQLSYLNPILTWFAGKTVACVSGRVVKMIKIVRTKISIYLPYDGQAVLICVLNFGFLLIVTNCMPVKWKNAMKFAFASKKVSLFASRARDEFENEIWSRTKKCQAHVNVLNRSSDSKPKARCRRRNLVLNWETPGVHRHLEWIGIGGVWKRRERGARSFGWRKPRP